MYSAPGSGKSTSISAAFHHFDGDAAVVDRTIYRRILIADIEGAIAEFHSPMRLTQEEGTRVFARTTDVFCRLLGEERGSPAAIFEISNLGDKVFLDQITGACQKSDKAAYMFLIYTPPGAAMERAFGRSVRPEKLTDEAKFIEPEPLIGWHRELSGDFEHLLAQNKGRPLVFEMLDNSVPKGQTKPVVAFGNTDLAEINILDFGAFCGYLEKRFIDTTAGSSEELFRTRPEDSRQQVTDTMIALSKSYQINLVDPKTSSVYAIISGEKLTVFDRKIFADNIGDNSRLASLEQQTLAGLAYRASPPNHSYGVRS